MRPRTSSALTPLFIVGFAVLFAGAFLPDSAAQAQSNRRNTQDTSARTYTVRGAVRSAVNDVAIEMVRVDLVRFTGETVGSTFTRSNGDFEFASVRNGEYFIDVKHHGHEAVREKIEVMNSSRVGIFIFIRPLDLGNPTSKDPSVSARDLTIPKKAAEAYNKGMEQLVRKSSPEGSLRHFDKAVVELDSYYEALHMRAVAYFQMGRLEDAARDFRASIEKSSRRYAEPYFGLAAMDTQGQKYAEAAELARQGLALDADSWRGHFELARAQMGLNKLDDAAVSIGHARQRKPDYADVHLVSANISMRRQDAPALLRDLDEYLKLQPTGPMADQARKMRDSIRSRLAAQAQSTAPPAEKKP